MVVVCVEVLVECCRDGLVEVDEWFGVEVLLGLVAVYFILSSA